MKETLYKIKDELKQPYFCALFLIALIPVFPEYISFVLVVAAAIFAGKDLSTNRRKIRIGIIGKLLMAFCTYQTLSCIYSPNPMATLAVSAMWWVFFLGYLTVINMLTDAQRTERFLLCITAVAGLVGLIACVQYRINFFLDKNIGNTWQWLDNIVFNILDGFGIDLFHLNYNLRAYSTFPNPNMLAQYLVMAAPFVACYNFMKQRTGQMRLFCRTCLFLTFAGVMFSFSRGGYIAILILAIGLIALNIRRRFASVSLYVVSTILFLPAEVVNRLFTIKKGISHSSTIADNIITAPKPPSGGGTTPPPISTDEIINSAGAETAVSERWEMWVESIRRFFDKPLFGHGAGTQVTFDIFQNIGVKAPHAHNIILQMMIEGGLTAILIMGLIGFFTVRNSIFMMKKGDNSSFWMGFSALAFGVCFMAHGMVDYPLMVPRLVCIFMILLGVIDQAVHVYAPQDDPSVSPKLRKRFYRNNKSI